MNKQDFWPEEGKLKKALVIAAIVIIGATAITLLEEKTQLKAGRKLPLIIAFACIAVWLYKPPKKTRQNEEIN